MPVERIESTADQQKGHNGHYLLTDCEHRKGVVSLWETGGDMAAAKAVAITSSSPSSRACLLRRLCEKPTRSVFSPKPKRIHVCTRAHAGYHRMRVEAGANPSQGSDIGKALEASDEGTGTIKTLALLQQAARAKEQAIVDSEVIRDLYRKRARHYDLAVWTYRLLGLREKMYRRHAVAALAPRPGDTVVDLACGTGLNFQFLQPLITIEGRTIAVDLTDAMLDVARKRAQSAGWSNIEFVQADMAEYEFPAGIGGVLSTFAISLVRQFDQVIHRGAAALRPGGRMAILDIKTPQHWPLWMARCTAWVNRPFGVTLETTYRRPWESLQEYLQEVCYREYFFGYLYLAVGQKPRRVTEERGRRVSKR